MGSAQGDVQGGGASAGSAHQKASNATTSNTGESYPSSALQGFNFLLGKRLGPDVVISALDSVSHVEILSSPSLVVMENKPAMLQVGDHVPVTTRTAQSNLSADAPTVNSVDYRDTGIILKIQPRVGQDGSVAMEIDAAPWHKRHTTRQP